MRLGFLVAVVGTVSASGCISPGRMSEGYGASAVRSNCDAPAEIARFMTIPKPRLTALDRDSGFLTTPLKYLSTQFDGPHAWERTRCAAAGFGRPVREAQHSTDGLYTVDVAITELMVEGFFVPPGRYVRLEVIPGTAAHRSLKNRRPEPSDLIGFRGPLVWDKDTDADHPFGHMEIHPSEAIEFVAPAKWMLRRLRHVSGTGSSSISHKIACCRKSQAQSDNDGFPPRVPIR